MPRTDARPEPPAAITDEADRLAKAVADLRRITRRTIRDDWPFAPLSPSQVELLRTVVDHPGIGVREAADHLRLAPNTVSTLVGSLTDADLIRRTRDQRDGRAARLEATPAASRRRAAWRDRRAHVIGTALNELEPVDREAIARAIPALERLTWQLGHDE
ncbi:MAG TPA: helix-turn-helix domain-containing protein [Acidimicrobiia bacterium]|jgi:DNA-binding MarR family transcriptional regulator